MRIACITTSYPRDEQDPSGHFVRAYVRAREGEGHVVTVVAPGAGDGGAFGWPGVAVRLRQNPLRAVGVAAWIAKATHGLARMGQLDRIVAHWALPSAFPIAEVRPEPLVIISHGGDVRLLASLPEALSGALVRRLAERCVEWQFVSDRLLDELSLSVDSATRARLLRVATIAAPPLEMPEVSGRVREAGGRMGGRSYSVVIGRLVKSKRVDAALQHARVTAPGERVIVIGDGPEASALREQAGRLGLHAEFVGRLPRDQTLGLLGAARRLLFASEAEGLSTVVREAEALGVPVVYVEH